MTTTIFSAQDEQPHAAGDAPGYSESVYFNFVADEGSLAGFVRLGNRVNAGHAEVSVVLYLRDGRVVFKYARPDIDGPSLSLDGLTVEVLEPLRRIGVRYDGDAHVLPDGRALANPREAFATSPQERVTVRLEFEDVMPLTGWKASGAGSDDPFAGGAWAPNHYEAVCRIGGEVTVGDERLPVTASGMRDRSWGERDWVAPEYYRWMSCFTPSGEGWVIWHVRMGGETRSWGFLRSGGETTPVADVAVSSTYDGDERYPATTEVTFSVEGETVTSRGERLYLVPLRHRRGDYVARLSEVIYRFDFRGETGHGLSEYHDQLIDGLPAGEGKA